MANGEHCLCGVGTGGNDAYKFTRKRGLSRTGRTGGYGGGSVLFCAIIFDFFFFTVVLNTRILRAKKVLYPSRKKKKNK